MNCFVEQLHGARLHFSDTKNVSCATTDALARAINSKIVGLTVRVASRVTSLGTGLGAGRRRNMLQIKKRLKGFLARRHRFKALRRAGVKTDRLVRTGGERFYDLWSAFPRSL